MRDSGLNENISLCCLDRHLPANWKYDESSIVIHHFPPPAHYSRWHLISLSLSPASLFFFSLQLFLFFYSFTSPSSLRSAFLLFYPLPQCLHPPHPCSSSLPPPASFSCYRLTFISYSLMCVPPFSLNLTTFPLISFSPLLHLLSASPYLFPSLPPLISLFITYTRALSSLHPQVQYSAYVGVGGLLSVVKLFCGGLFFWFLVKFSLGRKLLTTVATLFLKPTSYCNVCVGICSPEQIIWSPLEADFKGSRSFKMINPSIKVWMNATVRCGYLAERLTQSYSC